jgi:protein gp37
VSGYSPIEWTSSTWNPVTGCTRISRGCKHCYAERLAKRLKAMGQAKYRNGFRVTVHRDELERPPTWKKPHLIFTCSMGDLFHEQVPFAFIAQVFGVMARTERHVYQVLTKRSARLTELAPKLVWPDNVWMGVTVEAAECLERVEHLRRVPARVRFLSLEPLLGPLDELNLEGIDWVIVGGESGPGARVLRKEWVHRVREQCRAAGTAFFFKQWGGTNKKKSGRLLDGRTYSAMPEALRKHSPQLLLAP